jgi:signal transduction histidine kinase
MKLEIRSFRTKISRRIFTLFLVCAVVPILALAWVSFSQASRQIHDQSRSRLLQDTKTVGMAIFEGLSLLSAEMRAIAPSLIAGGGRPLQEVPKTLAKRIQERFTTLALLTKDGEYIRILGSDEIPREMSREELEHILAEKTLLRHRVKPDSPPAIYMYAGLDLEHPGRGILMAEINTAHLWQVAEARPAGTELYVLDRTKNVLFTSASGGSGTEAGFLSRLNSRHSGLLEWQDTTGAQLAAYWTILFEPRFLSPRWFVLLSRPRDEALAPMVEFRKAFVLIIAFSLSVVFFLSFRLIRKNMVPIEILREATQKIAQGSFGDQVEIRSGDEFEALGKSFNEMSEKLREGQTLLVRAAKLSTMGQMAAGVMHELGQPLTAITGRLELALLNEPSPQQKKHLEVAAGAVERLNAILKRFRSFSHTSQEKMECLSLGQVVDQVHTLMEHQFRMKRIQCTVHAEENLPPVLGDQQGLHQVFSNLVINAVQAMEEKQEGQRALDIRLSSSDGKVRVEIEDTGCGMSAEVMKRMFDPFFTTKDQERGTGLGMAIVESILHKHGAKIEVDSKIGVGTTFTFAFATAPTEGSPCAGRG